MVRGDVDVCFGAFLECEATLFQRADDLATRFGRDEDVVRKVGGNEEYRAEYVSVVV